MLLLLLMLMLCHAMQARCRDASCISSTRSAHLRSRLAKCLIPTPLLSQTSPLTAFNREEGTCAQLSPQEKQKEKTKKEKEKTRQPTALHCVADGNQLTCRCRRRRRRRRHCLCNSSSSNSNSRFQKLSSWLAQSGEERRGEERRGEKRSRIRGLLQRDACTAHLERTHQREQCDK